MVMKNIYLVRHGESEGNVDLSFHKNCPDHAIPLSALGRAQAYEAGHALVKLMVQHQNAMGVSNTRVWSSPYRRTRETAAQIYSTLERSIWVDQREHINLCEQQFGLFDGIPDEELPTRFPEEHAHYKLSEEFEGRFWARMPLGESRFDVAVRIHQAFGTFQRDAANGIENIVVICHGVTMRAFVMQWLHLPYEWFDKEKNPGNCDIIHINCARPSLDELGYAYVYKDGKLLQECQ